MPGTWVGKLYIRKPPGKPVVTYTGKESKLQVAETILKSEARSLESREEGESQKLMSSEGKTHYKMPHVVASEEMLPSKIKT